VTWRTLFSRAQVDGALIDRPSSIARRSGLWRIRSPDAGVGMVADQVADYSFYLHLGESLSKAVVWARAKGKALVPPTAQNEFTRVPDLSGSRFADHTATCTSAPAGTLTPPT